jgi:DNA mismatch repair protein MutL
MTIHVLADDVVSQIAAGEVVERPASVVKELVENSLDAGAGKITVRVNQSGRRLIEVADDGCGIPTSELQLAVLRHATSKLLTADDLFRISTLGFRGEALASIGSVSRMTLTSRTSETATGALMLVEGGQVRAREETGVPVGTTVKVEDLFFNVPARLKFLKSDTTERQQIDGLVTRYALAYPQVRFQLYHDDRPVLRTTGNGDQREILTSLYGVDIARQMIAVIFEEEIISINGFISPISLTRSNRKEITFFVNGRWIQDSALSAALMQAYRTLLMVGRFPMSVLFIQLESSEVDVNVHPAKAEVRFRSPDRIFGYVQRAVRRGLLASSPVPQISSTTWQSMHGGNQFPSQPVIDPAWAMAADLKYQPAVPQTSEQPAEESLPESAPVLPQSPLPGSSLPLLRLVGQVGGTYLIAEGPDGLYLIDQHAAHERVLFEKFMNRAGTSFPSQSLLQPAVVQLPPYQSTILESQRGVLNLLGFQIELFGPDTYRVMSIPVILTGIDPVSAVRSVVEDFEEDETPLQTMVEARIAARICKRVAVKGGQTLSTEEQQNLLRELESCQSPRTCPHGRPTMIHLSVDLLERQFGRRGSR